MLLTGGCALQGVRAHQDAVALETNAYEAEVARDKRQNAAMAEANRKRMAALQGELDAALQAKCAPAPFPVSAMLDMICLATQC